MMMEEEQIKPELLKEKIIELYENRQKYITAMEKSPTGNAVETITSIFEEIVG